MTEYKIKLIPSSSFLQFKRDRESGNQIKLTGLEVDYITSNRTPLTSSTTPAQVENEFRLVSGSFNDIIRETGDIVTAYRIDRDYYKLEFINRFYNKSFVGFLIKYKASGVSNYVPAFLSKELTGGKLFTERSVAKICIYANIPDAVMEGYYTPTVDVSKFLLPEDRAAITYDDEQLTTIVTLDTYLDTVAQNLPAYRNGTYFEDSNKLVHMKVLGGNPYDYRGIMEKMMATFTTSIKSFGNVVDHLNSTNSRDALAATQGRVLNLKKLDIGDFSDWSTVNQNDIPIFRRTNGTVVTPKSLREFYEVLMEVLDNRSITRIYTINNFSDTTVTIPHNLGSKWHGISSITNAFVSEDDSKWKEIPETAINVTVDATNIIATIDKSKLPEIFKDTTDEPNSKLYNANSEKRGRITIVIDKNAVALAGIPPLLKMDKLVIGRRTTDPNKNVTLTGTIRFSSGTLKEKLVVTGATAVGAPRFTQDTHNPKIYHIEQDIEAKDNETMEVKVQGFADYNGEELPSNVVTTEVTLKRILKPEILDVSHTINLNYDSQNNNYEMTITPNTLYVGAHLKFTPSHVKFTTVPKELKEMLQVNKAYPVGTPIKMRISSLVDLKKLSGDQAIRLVGIYTDQTGFDSNSWSDPYTTNINLKDLFKSISWEDSSSVEDKYINYTKAYKEYKAYPTAPVLYELKPKVQGAVDKSKIQYSIVNLPADSQKFAPFITIEGDKVKVDYVGLAAQLNNAKDIEEIRFDVRARAKDAQGGDVYYNNLPLLAIKSFTLKIHSNAVLVISLVNLMGNEDAAGLLFFGATEISKARFKVFSSNEDVKKTEWTYDLSAGSSSEEWEQLQTNMMGYIMPNGKVNEQEWRDRNALFKVIGENNLVRFGLSYDDSVDPNGLIKDVGFEIIHMDDQNNLDNQWNGKNPALVPWNLRYGSDGGIKLKDMTMNYLITRRSNPNNLAIRGMYTVEVNGVKSVRYTDIIYLYLTNMRDFRYDLIPAERSYGLTYREIHYGGDDTKVRPIPANRGGVGTRGSWFLFDNRVLTTSMDLTLKFKPSVPFNSDSIKFVMNVISLPNTNAISGTTDVGVKLANLTNRTTLKDIVVTKQPDGAYLGKIAGVINGSRPNDRLIYLSYPDTNERVNGKAEIVLSNPLTNQVVSSGKLWILRNVSGFKQFLDFAVEVDEIPRIAGDLNYSGINGGSDYTTYRNALKDYENDYSRTPNPLKLSSQHWAQYDTYLNISGRWPWKDEEFDHVKAFKKFLTRDPQTGKLKLTKDITSSTDYLEELTNILHRAHVWVDWEKVWENAGDDDGLVGHNPDNDPDRIGSGRGGYNDPSHRIGGGGGYYKTVNVNEWRLNSTPVQYFEENLVLGGIYVVNPNGSFTMIGTPRSDSNQYNNADLRISWPIGRGDASFRDSNIGARFRQLSRPLDNQYDDLI